MTLVANKAAKSHTAGEAFGRTIVISLKLKIFYKSRLFQIFKTKFLGGLELFVFFYNFAFYRQYFYFLFSHRGIKILAYVYLYRSYFTLFL